ncbi:hypothetical protein Cgig2_019882 [Carnegiea gigantea]|uniref:Expansin-like EG45 domain-containing protein n=1 Tax=Carnegiea gigantea TaxID=171969 RepID=A0A9Q1KK52_9CARY|nr:hypothetical protein Cgig2_019882 [Carnegiea gigantea]
MIMCVLMKKTFSTDGACGYGDYGRTVNDGLVAVAASSKLYRNGAGCGACYKVKCKKVECNQDGVVVVVTDYVGVGNETDLVLSANAYTKMAQPGGEKVLVAYGKVDVEYERVSCQYPGKTLMLKVLEDSRYNSYLSMQFLYQAGRADINAVEVFEGPLTVRFFLDGDHDNVKARWVLMRNVVPAFWEPGASYDTEIQLD